MAQTKVQTISTATAAAERARALELDLAAGRLVCHVFAETDSAAAGRYRFLARALEKNPALTDALIRGDAAAIGRGWTELTARQQSNVEFLHGMAVLYRECALALLAKGQADGRYGLLSCGLWSMLLGADEFWLYFGKRFGQREKMERLAGVDVASELLEATAKAVFSLHAGEAARHAAAGNYASADPHFRCLNLCRRPAPEIESDLGKAGVACRIRTAGERMEIIRRIADGLLDDWCVSLVRGAEKMLDDPEAIARLPRGISRNFEGALEQLEAFIKLNIPSVRVLRTSLQWYNTWCYELYVTSEGDHELLRRNLRPVLARAQVAAGQLTPLCVKGRGHLPENKELSRHLMIVGLVSEGPEHGQPEYKEALAWDPSNQNAQNLLGEAAQAVVMKQIDTALEQCGNGHWQEAYEVLDNVEQQAGEEGKDRVRQARAVVHFRHANELANEGRYRDAFAHAREARSLEPDHPVVKKLHDDIAELAPEEDNVRHLKTARDAMEHERFEDAIAAASQIPKRSKFHEHGRQLQSGAHYRQGIEHLKAGRLEEAIHELEQALELNTDTEECGIIRNQIEQVKGAQWGKRFQEAIERKDWTTAARMLREALSEKMPDKQRKNLQSQLSMVLNAHAVQLMNEAAESEKKLGEAMVDIISAVKAQIN